MEISCRNEYINDGQMIAFADTLQYNHTITRLYLNGNNFGEAGLIALTAALTQPHRQGTPSDLNESGVRDAGLIALATFLETNHTLTQLSLWRAEIGDEGTRALAGALAVNRTLTVLVLDDNNIGFAGVEALSQTITTNHTLRCIDLTNNDIGNAGVNALVAAFVTNHTQTRIGLAGNGIGTDGFNAILKAFETFPKLTTNVRFSFHEEVSEEAVQAMALFRWLNQNHRSEILRANFVPALWPHVLFRLGERSRSTQRLNTNISFHYLKEKGGEFLLHRTQQGQKRRRED